MIRVLITGARIWTDSFVIAWAIRREVIARGVVDPQDVTIVHGDCPQGADKMADAIAVDAGYRVEKHPADWDAHGKKAGYLRNAQMVKLGADVCLAFISGESRGTRMCADLAEKAGIPTQRILA